MHNGKYRAFLADDSEDDRFFLKKILVRSSNIQVIGEARDGQETLEYLKGEGFFSDREKYPFPDLLLLDIKMPRKNGYDVLQWIQAQPSSPLTVVMVSGSWLAEDIAKSLALGAHGYFKKTSIRAEQDEMLAGIEALLEKQKPGT